MSAEESFDVTIPQSQQALVLRLQRSAAAAAERHKFAPIGDQTEAVRYEHILAAIHDLAYEELDRVQRGVPSKDLSTTVVNITWPFAVGTASLATGRTPKTVAEVFRSALDGPSPREATEERFGRQLSRALESHDDPHRAHVNPSDIPNRVLSESLRAFFATVEGEQKVEAPVTYRDGSTARPLPLRSVPFVEDQTKDVRKKLAVTLLSIRHMEMDEEVDGAWLRNREISLRRPAGETDELVYQQSLDQFAAIASDGPVLLELYQTGLPPANVGFYRALIDHHRQRRGANVAVVPRYFEGPHNYPPGTPWVIAQ